MDSPKSFKTPKKDYFNSNDLDNLSINMNEDLELTRLKNKKNLDLT